jgi:hypothetical protein
MKKIIFIAFLFISINSYAVKWEKVVDLDGDSYYVDIENIKSHNGFVYYWTMYDYLEPLAELGYLSGIGKYKVDCEKKKQTWLTLSLYSLNMGKGKLLSDEKPNQTVFLQPRMPMYKAMEFACKGKGSRLLGPLEFSNKIKEETKKRLEKLFNQDKL